MGRGGSVHDQAPNYQLKGRNRMALHKYLTSTKSGSVLTEPDVGDVVHVPCGEELAPCH
jgi:hypothetical protein